MAQSFGYTVPFKTNHFINLTFLTPKEFLFQGKIVHNLLYKKPLNKDFARYPDLLYPIVFTDLCYTPPETKTQVVKEQLCTNVYILTTVN